VGLFHLYRLNKSMITYQQHLENMQADPMTYIMSLAKAEPVHVDIKKPCNFIRGCKNYIWFEMIPKGTNYGFLFASGSNVSLGMCLILGSYMVGKTPEQMAQVKFSDLREFTKYLPGERQKGVQAVLNSMHKQLKDVDTAQY
jgi:sulfur transfer protein SufE